MAESSTQAPKDIIGFLDFYLVGKAPAIPEQAREWIVKWGPWIAVVLLALSVPVILALIGISAAWMPFGGFGYYGGWGIGTAFLIAHFALMIAALPGLFARRMQGWRLMFYAEGAWFIEALIFGAYANALIGGLIAFYILFQIRSKYR